MKHSAAVAERESNDDLSEDPPRPVLLQISLLHNQLKQVLISEKKNWTTISVGRAVKTGKLKKRKKIVKNGRRLGVSPSTFAKKIMVYIKIISQYN